MPTFMDLQKRLKRQDRMNVRLGTEETLIVDVRGRMRPGEFVDQKLRAVEGSGQLSSAIASAAQASLRN